MMKWTQVFLFSCDDIADHLISALFTKAVNKPINKFTNYFDINLPWFIRISCTDGYLDYPEGLIGQDHCDVM